MDASIGRLAAWCLVILVGCTPEAASENITQGPHPLWSTDAQSIQNPFPDGRLVDAQGRLDLRAEFYLPFLPDGALTPETDTLFLGYDDDFRQTDGFSTFGSVFVLLSEPLDEDTLQSGALALVALDEEAAPIQLQRDWRADPGFLEAQPVEPLLPAERYALVIGTGFSAGGKPLTRSPDFDAHARGDGRADVELAAQRAGIAVDDVVLVVSYRTQETLGQMRDAALLVQETTGAIDFSVPSPSGRPRGVFTRAEFVASHPEHTASLTGASTVAYGTFQSLDVRDAEGHLDVAGSRSAPRRESLEVVLVEPDPQQHPPPWPVVLAQHGFSGSNRFVIDVAQPFNDAGFAVVGIDAVDHGTRGNIFNFFDVANVRRVRDKFRQTVLDQLQLAAILRAGSVDIDGVAGADFNGTVHYFGHSMGAIVGSMYTALAPGAPVAVLNAGGGGISRIFESEGLRGGIGLLARPALGLSLDDPAYELALPWMESAAQVMFDAGDPINYGGLIQSDAPHRTRAPRVLMQEGLRDRIVPNAQTEQLAHAMHLTTLTAPTEDAAGLQALWQVDAVAEGASPEDDPHNIFFLLPGVRQQAVEFLLSDGTRVTAP